MAWNLRPEDRLQIAACKLLRVLLPSGAVVRSIDHGTKMNDTRRLQLRARGVLGGLPDMMVWWNRRHAQIELKVGTTQSTHQREHQQRMIEQGFDYAVCHSLEEIEAAFRGWAWPVNATVQAPAPQQRVPTAKKKPAAPRAKRATAAAKRVGAAFHRP
jgi:hypothetical protein